MPITRLSPLGISGPQETFSDKTPADYPAFGLLVTEFDLWREGYDSATINILYAGTSDLMPCYSDVGLTQQVENPQVLITKQDDQGNLYGKFQTSVYVPFAYQLEINGVEETGAEFPPIITLDGEDASLAEVKTTGTQRFRTLADRFGDVITVEDFGQLTDSEETNTSIIESAISAASLQGGGVVLFPAGTIVFNSFSLPSNVVLRGHGVASTILQSQVATNVITVTGDNCGMADLKLDGVNLNGGSKGLYGKNIEKVILENVIITRFDTGVLWLGGVNHIYRNFDITNCNYAFRGIGDSNQFNGADGGEFYGLDWFQGRIAENTIVGFELSVKDLGVRDCTLRQVDIEDNIGTDGAVFISGAQFTTFRDVYLINNTNHLIIQDSQDTTDDDLRQMVSFTMTGGAIDSSTSTAEIEGILAFDGLCQDIIFDRVQLNFVSFEMNVPTNQILFRDCVEIDTTISGDTTKLSRFLTTNCGTVKGNTTDDTPTVVWKRSLEANEIIVIEVNATAEYLNSSNEYAAWKYVQCARCNVAQLAYDGQSANYTPGLVVTGQTSGATGIIVSQNDSGATGTINLAHVSGTFLDNELITDTGGGSATVNGSLSLGNAALIGAAAEVLAVGSDTLSPPAGVEVTFGVSQQEVQVLVTGDSAKLILWTLDVNVTSLPV